jgi:glycosyltransferase involved in cell wall biosynthesis
VASLGSWVTVVVVDDGSGPECEPLFDQCELLGAVVLHHEANAGKAAALRTGFAWLRRNHPREAVVCADGDGQHTPEDIRRVAQELESRTRAGLPDAVVLGVREFTGTVPARSRFGNAATSWLVRVVTGARIADTQTGLRGYPPGLIPWLLQVRGERFAYELRMLLDATREWIPVVEVPVATVYHERNESSHFRPLVDSLKVMMPLALFAASSLIAFGVDTTALLGLNAVTGNLAVSVVGARLVSATTNFTLNRRTVFRSRGPLAPQIAKYVALACVLLAASYAGLWAMTTLGLPLLAAKLLTDLALWLASYAIQRSVVFSQHTRLRESMSHHPTHLQTF